MLIAQKQNLLNGISAGAITRYLSDLPPISPVTSDQFRLLITEPEGATVGRTVSVAEFKLYDAAGAEISLSGATATASANWGGTETPASAIDGDPATWWAGRTDTTGNEGWLQVILPSPAEVGGFSIQARASDLNTCPKTFKLQWWDGSAWQDFYAPGDFHTALFWKAGEIRTYRISDRWWRVRSITSTGDNSGFAEVQFRTTAGESESHTTGWSDTNGRWDAAQDSPQAFDGNPATHWGMAGPTGWVGYVFPERKRVQEIMLQARADEPDAPASFALEWSDHMGLVWQTAMRYQDLPAWTPGEIRTFRNTARMPALTINHLGSDYDYIPSINVTYPTPGAPTRIIIVNTVIGSPGVGNRPIWSCTVNGIPATFLGGNIRTAEAYGHGFWAVEVPPSDSVTIVTDQGSVSGHTGWRATQVLGVSWSEFMAKVEYRRTTDFMRPTIDVDMDGPGVILAATGFGNFTGGDVLQPLMWESKANDRFNQYTYIDTAKRVSLGTASRCVLHGAISERISLFQYQTYEPVPLGVLILRTTGETIEEENIQSYVVPALYSSWSYSGTQHAALSYRGNGSDRQIIVVVFHHHALVSGMEGMKLLETIQITSPTTATIVNVSIFHAQSGAMKFPIQFTQAASGRLYVFSFGVETTGGVPDISVIASGVEPDVGSIMIPEHESTAIEQLFVAAAKILGPTSIAAPAVPTGWTTYGPTAATTNRRMGLILSPVKRAGDIEPAFPYSVNGDATISGIGYIYFSVKANPDGKQALQRASVLNKYAVVKAV